MFRVLLALSLIFGFCSSTFADEKPKKQAVVSVERTGVLVVVEKEGKKRFFLQEGEKKVRLRSKTVKFAEYKDGDKVVLFGKMRERGKRSFFVVTKMALQK